MWLEELQRLAAVSQRLIGTGREQPCQVVGGLEIGGAEPQGFLVEAQRVVEAPLVRGDQAERAVDRCDRGLECQRPFELLTRLVEALRAEQCEAQ